MRRSRFLGDKRHYLTASGDIRHRRGLRFARRGDQSAVHRSAVRLSAVRGKSAKVKREVVDTRELAAFQNGVMR